MITRDDIVAWSCMAAAVLCVLYHAGCAETDTPTGYSGAPELVAWAEASPPEQRHGPVPCAVKLEWGDESLCYRHLITIDRAERGTKWARVHVEHEVGELYKKWLNVDDPELAAKLDRDHRINAGG